MQMLERSLNAPYFPSFSGPGKKRNAEAPKEIWSDRLYVIDGEIKEMCMPPEA